MTSVDWRRRFEDLAARRTRDASAPLPKVRTLLDRAEGISGLDAIGDAWTQTAFDGAFYQTGPHDGGSAGVVFVRSRDGNTGSRNPAALGGGPVDEHLIYEGLTRVAADAVAVGAGTLFRDSLFTIWAPRLIELRTELGRPRHPAQIVLSADGSITPDDILLFNLPDVPVFVVTSPAGRLRLSRALDERPWIHTITGASLREQFRAIRDAGIHRVVSVGGRRSASGLVDACLVRDVYLTTTESSAGQPGTPWYTGTRELRTSTVLLKEWNGPDGIVRFEHAVLENDASVCPPA